MHRSFAFCYQPNPGEQPWVRAVWPKKTSRFGHTRKLGEERGGCFGWQRLAFTCKAACDTPWALRHKPRERNDTDETKPRCLWLPPLVHHSGSRTTRAGIWSPDPWSPLGHPRPLGSEKVDLFIQHPLPHPLRTKNKLAGGGPELPPALRNLTPTRAVAGVYARQAKGLKPQDGRARLQQ